jgi:undecaprenyl diphosphate synthase
MPDTPFDPFTPEERAAVERLDPTRIPRHIAVIMDGNGRWAVQRSLPRPFGHRAGVEAVRAVADACDALGVRYLTLYSFSTENWSREGTEVDALMGLIEEQFRIEMLHLHKRNARVRHLGRSEGLPDSLKSALRDIQKLTAANTGLTLQFAINYSGRAEIADAARKLAQEAVAGARDPDAITEEVFAAALYAPDVPDPDLLVRTAGELRVSNYLLWQIAYSELWSTPVLWPDFRAAHLLDAIAAYQSRLRTFGGGNG